MKSLIQRLSVLLLAVAAILPAHSARAEGTTTAEFNEANIDLLDLALQSVSTLDLINWKVGDTMNYDVSMGGFAMGNSVKSVTKDEGTAVWLRQAIRLMSQNETIDALINKADGKLLKLIRNGQEQTIPDDKLEIISQDAGEISVKAGKFQAIHIVAKTKQVSKLEVWANPRDTALDGTLKQIAATQFGNMTLELTSFRRN